MSAVIDSTAPEWSGSRCPIERRTHWPWAYPTIRIKRDDLRHEMPKIEAEDWEQREGWFLQRDSESTMGSWGAPEAPQHGRKHIFWNKRAAKIRVRKPKLEREAWLRNWSRRHVTVSVTLSGWLAVRDTMNWDDELNVIVFEVDRRTDYSSSRRVNPTDPTQPDRRSVE